MTLRSLRFLLALALLATLAGCPGEEEAEPAEATPAVEPERTPTPPMKAPGAEPKPTAEASEPTPAPEYDNPAMLDPKLANETAPDTYAVKFETTKGDIIIDVNRADAPNGADRFYNLVKIGYYDDVAFFRVIEGFMAQVGIHGDPAVNTVWRDARIKDDPVKSSNVAGAVTFAMAGPNTRTTQIFLNFKDNKNLDGMNFASFGKVRSMDVLNTIYSGYGEGAPRGRGPHQGALQSKGNAYLKQSFPELDYIKKATILEE